MSETDEYKCVNCGTAAAALYRTYGPSVLKLTKCVSFKYFQVPRLRGFYHLIMNA